MSTTVTQRNAVLTMLYNAGKSGVCGTAFLRAQIPRYSARIIELRNDGHRIERVRCYEPGHDSVQWRYVLTVGEQLTLEEATK